MANGLVDHELFDPCNRTIGEKGSVAAPEQITHDDPVCCCNKDERVPPIEELPEGPHVRRPIRSVRKGKFLYQGPHAVDVFRLGWADLDSGHPGTAGLIRMLLRNGDVAASTAADRDRLAYEVALRFEESPCERLVGPGERPHTVCRLGDDDPALV
jgi:hypothetical protein